MAPLLVAAAAPVEIKPVRAVAPAVVRVLVAAAVAVEARRSVHSRLN
jgi:hypothetical protein